MAVGAWCVCAISCISIRVKIESDGELLTGLVFTLAHQMRPRRHASHRNTSSIENFSCTFRILRRCRSAVYESNMENSFSTLLLARRRTVKTHYLINSFALRYVFFLLCDQIKPMLRVIKCYYHLEIQNVSSD